MKQKISILGCGWLGMALAIELINKGYSVKGSTTSTHKIDQLKANQIEPFKIDTAARDDDYLGFLNSDILIIAITSKNMRDFEHLITQIESSKLQKVIFVSSTSVYPNTNGIVNEDSPVNYSSLSEIENLFKSNNTFQCTIIRFGGLFGYNRKPGNFFKTGKQIGNPDGFINFIHRDDCIGIIQRIIETNTWSTTFNAVADSHPSRREFYTQEFNKIGRPDPIFNEKSLNEFKIVSSDKLKSLLGYQFKHSDLTRL